MNSSLTTICVREHNRPIVHYGTGSSGHVENYTRCWHFASRVLHTVGMQYPQPLELTDSKTAGVRRYTMNWQQTTRNDQHPLTRCPSHAQLLLGARIHD